MSNRVLKIPGRPENVPQRVSKGFLSGEIGHQNVSFPKTWTDQKWSFLAVDVGPLGVGAGPRFWTLLFHAVCLIP